MIESGQAESNSDLARKLKLDQSYVARTIRLASLAPSIMEASHHPTPRPSRDGASAG